MYKKVPQITIRFHQSENKSLPGKYVNKDTDLPAHKREPPNCLMFNHLLIHFTLMDPDTETAPNHIHCLHIPCLHTRVQLTLQVGFWPAIEPSLILLLMCRVEWTVVHSAVLNFALQDWLLVVSDTNTSGGA